MSVSEDDIIRRFGDFELTSRPLALRRGGAPVELRHQALKLLALFVERAGSLVTQDDIRARVWGGQHVDFAGGIHALIREIRLALGDDAAAPRFIETLPRQGYRFIAPLRADAPAAPLATRKPARRRMALAASLALVAGLAALALTRGGGEASPARAAALKGEFLLDKGGAENLEKSAAQFAEALALDAAYAPALAGLAEIAVMKGDYKRAESQASAALAADGSLASAHLHLGMVAALKDWDWRGAEARIDRALALDPTSAKAYGAKAMLAVILGRNDQALEAARRAYALDPVSALIRADHGWFHYYAGDPATALSSCAAAAELAPEIAGIAYCEMKAAAASGDIEAASTAAARILGFWKAEDALASRLAAHPSAETLRDFYVWQRDAALALDAKGEISKEALAAALAEAGDTDAAADALLDAARSHSAMFPLIARDPVFAPLRDDQRYRAALAAAGIIPPGAS